VVVIKCIIVGVVLPSYNAMIAGAGRLLMVVLCLLIIWSIVICYL